MANRDLLKEAIADAKALKETAIANAKAALEEAFEPRLKSMLSAKLEEMEKEDMDEGYDTYEAKEEMDESSNIDPGTEPKGFLRRKPDSAMIEEEEMDEDMVDEVDLDEILAELEEGEDAEDVNEAEDVEENITEAEEEEDEAEGEDEEVEAKDEEIDLEDMSEDDLKSFIEDVIADMVDAGELEAGDEFEAEDEMDSEEEIDIDVEDEAETMMEGKEEVEEGVMDKLKAIYNDPEVLGKIITVDGKKMSLKDFLAMAGGATAGSMAGGGQATTKTPGSGVSEADEDVMEEVNALRAELHEVNLLNAKLLYTNKIFRAKNLREAQKVKVLEAFDKAETVKEVKLVFETMNGNLTNVKKQVVKENLGSASKAAGIAPQTKSNIVDVNPQFARMQKLAGLK